MSFLFLELLYFNAAIVGCCLSSIWTFEGNHLWIKNYWGIGFVLISLFTYFREFLFRTGEDYAFDKSIHSALLVLLVCVWGLRISLFNIWRNHKRTPSPFYGRLWKQLVQKGRYLNTYSDSKVSFKLQSHCPLSSP